MFLTLAFVAFLLLNAVAVPVRKSEIHVIVLDAGSTGTRLNFYRFTRDIAQTYGFKVVGVIEKKDTPGLSSFIDDPNVAAEHVRSLLETVALETANGVRDTIIFKATAGLRLAAVSDPAKADAVLNAVKDLITKEFSDRYILPENGSGILSGSDEGNYAWLGVNFLTNTLSNPSHSYGTLDLGGGSTQIVFYVEPSTKKRKVPNDFISSVTAFGRTYNLYSHSYLGEGKNAAMQNMLKVSDSCKVSDCSTEPALTSSCLNPNFTAILSFGPSKVRVKGDQNTTPDSRSSDCRKVAKKAVKNIQRVDAGNITNFYAFSAYYHIFDRAQMIQPSGEVPLTELSARIEEVCRNPPTDGKYMPYICMDLNYVAQLLSKYGLIDKTKLMTAQKIDGIPIGWAFGIAISEAYNIFQASEK